MSEITTQRTGQHEISEDQQEAIKFLEQGLLVVQTHLEELRQPWQQTGLALFTARIELQDAGDTIRLATRHMERCQRAVELTEPDQD